MLTVAKFGGSSLADADQFRKVVDIVRSDSARKCIVVSAPGKRHSSDQKVTDLLYEWHRLHELELSAEEVKLVLQERFEKIVEDLAIGLNVVDEIEIINTAINRGVAKDYVASRGEYMNAKILAEALGYQFVDAERFIFFPTAFEVEVDEVVLKEALKSGPIVVPGFYGLLPDTSIKTFSRGGSDITGALVAEALKADLYENWTDVSGLLIADPRIVDSPKQISRVTYRELRELSYMGASVFHEEAMFPVQRAGIATNIRNTNDPLNEGTYIIGERDRWFDKNIVTGIAGRKNFTVITVEKAMMNQEIGFALQVLSILESFAISFEHMPGGIDTLSFVIADEELRGKSDEVCEEIERRCKPDSVEMYPNMALVAVVGRGMAHSIGVVGKMGSALANAEVNIRMVNQGSSEINIIIGVDNKDFELAIRALYEAFVQ